MGRRPGRGAEGCAPCREERGAETRSLRCRRRRGSRPPRFPGPARPWGILGAGGAGRPFSGRARLQGPSGCRGLKPACAAAGLVCPAPAAAMAALPLPDEQDFIQAYEEVREKYKGTAAAPGPPWLPADCCPGQGLRGPAVRPLTPRPAGVVLIGAQTPGSPPASLDRGRRGSASQSPVVMPSNRAWRGAGGWRLPGQCPSFLRRLHSRHVSPAVLYPRLGRGRSGVARLVQQWVV